MKEEEILEAINSKDIDYFKDIYYNGDPNVSVVYDQNYGDGNDYIVCLYFKLLKIYVLLLGTYSSWDDSHWSSVSLAEPFEHIETRYKPISVKKYLKHKDE